MPVNGDASVTEAEQNAPNRVHLHANLSAQSDARWSNETPNWDYGSKPLLILELRFQICSFVLLCPWGAVANWVENIVPWLFFPPSRAGRGVRTAHSWCSSRCFESNCCMPESLEITNYLRNYRTSSRQLWHWSRRDWNRFPYAYDWQGGVVLEADSVWDPLVDDICDW